MRDLRIEACFVDGAWIATGDWIEVRNPATGALVGRVPACGGMEAGAAVAAAAAALPAWAALTGAERSRVLRRYFDLLIAHREALARLLTAEQGKPLTEALTEVDYAASFIEWYAEEAKRAYGDVISATTADRRILVLKQPIGVVAAITPWNFPAAMITRKIGPALAAGCTVVVKPAEQTPFTALALALLAQEAGLPRGTLNVVTGDPVAIGKMLTESDTVRKISFTGSTATGATLYAQSAPTIKKLSLELGGNAPFIVFDDADIPAAIRGAMQAKFRNAGQTCISPNRFYAQDAVYDAFVDGLAEAATALRVGEGIESGVEVGPLIDARALAKVEAHIADARAKGATVICGGSRHALGGLFFEPTVIGTVTNDMVLTREETFGPIAPVSCFSTEAEAVALANATEFGLAAYVYTRDVSRTWRVAEALEAGIVGVNTGLVSTEVAPFGGVKHSGLGREGSRYGLDDYLEMKYVCIGL